MFKNILLATAVSSITITTHVFALTSNIQTSNYIDLPTAFNGGEGARSINSKPLQRTIQSVGIGNKYLTDLVFGENVLENVTEFVENLYLASHKNAAKGTEVAQSKVKSKKGNRSLASIEADVSCDAALYVGIRRIQIENISDRIVGNMQSKFGSQMQDSEFTKTDSFRDVLRSELDKAVKENEISTLDADLIYNMRTDAEFKDSIANVLLSLTGMARKDKEELLAALQQCGKRS